MNKPIFSKKIHCMVCGKRYKSKIERGVRRYVCSNYDRGNYDECPKRMTIAEDYLINLITNRYGKLTDSEIIEKVDYIEMYDKWETEGENGYKLIIHFHDDKPITLAKNDKLWIF